MHVLLVEDNALVASGIKSGLALNGMLCELAATVADPEHLVNTCHFDVCVLDLGLPDGDGLNVLAKWRARELAMPVLILTAKGTLEDKVRGFQSGGDDYLSKPFDLQELVLRLQALHRRAAGRASDWLQWGEWRINLATHEAWHNEVRIDLARREWAVLGALLNANGRVLSPAQLHDSVYGFEQDVGSNAINVHVHNLRRKLSPDWIETVRGVGFKLGSAYCRGVG